MMKMMFFFMGVPLMIMSFFQVQDVLPYANQIEIISNGNTVVLSQEQQDDLMQEIKDLLADSHTVPAFGVVFGEGIGFSFALIKPRVPTLATFSSIEVKI